MDWNGKPYHSLDYEMKQRFHTKVYKIALEAGMTCPNRDGTLGTGGCIFCSAGGSGEFAAPPVQSVTRQIELAAQRISHKLGQSPQAYIAYFQSYTNTYAPLDILRPLFYEAIAHPLVKVLSIATRPDCLPAKTLDLLQELNRIKPVWVELGLQTYSDDTALRIRRGYPLTCFENTLQELNKRNLETIVHVILGLPGENRDQMLQTISYLARSPIQGVKLQLLHILKGTDLAILYEQGKCPVFTMEEYLDLVLDCISLLPGDLVIHRITGDGPKSLLIAPLWSANKRLVLNSMTRRFRERNIYQGCALASPAQASSEPGSFLYH